MNRKTPFFVRIGAAFGGAALLWVLSVCMIRGLGRILLSLDGLLGADTAETLGGIFGALSTAEVRPAVVWLWLCGTLAVLLSYGCRRRWAVAVLSAVLCVIGWGGAVVFASVNGVVFFDVIRSLAEMAAGGLFDLL